ncbi:MAG: hypothetical protein J5639_02170 [Bacteroidales bacterium]|nr:hypothetical protein [Bacteroidales bacterium]
MSVESDIFLIGVAGSRKSIIRMMNAAIRNAGNGEVIVEDDDIDAINLKLKEFIGREGKSIGVSDLLDEACLENQQVQEKKKMLNACNNCPFDCPHAKRDAGFVAPENLEDADEEEYYKKMRNYCPWGEPYEVENPGPSRDIEIVRVEAGSGDNYTAKFSQYLYECYYGCDWVDWEDIARLYDCRVFIDDNYYSNGRFMRFEAATIYEPVEGVVKTTRLESGSTDEEYDTFMETLAKQYPDRYRPIRDRYLKKKEDEKERVRLEKERGIKIHYTVWHNFASWEEDCTKAIRCTYAAHLEEAEKKNAWLTKEDLETVMNLRMEKWKGVKDELAKCYESLLKDLHDEDQW